MLLLTVDLRHYLRTGDVIFDILPLLSILHRTVNIFAKIDVAFEQEDIGE